MIRRATLLQVLRKVVQLSVVLGIVYAAASMHWRNFKVAHNSSRIVGLMTNETNAELYRWNHWFLSFFGEPLAVSDGFLGGPWAGQVAGVPIVDPWATAAVLVGGSWPPAAMWVGAALPLVVAALLGKVFCSWMCPARLAFEAGNALRRGLLWLDVPLMELQLPRIGGWVGVALLLFTASAGPGIFHYVLPYFAASSSLIVWFTSGAVISAALWFVLLVAFDALLAPGQICRSLCPTGALLETVGRRPLLVLARADEACPPSCDLCQRACPYGLFPGRRTHRPACDSCGRCEVACPRGRLKRRFVMPWRAAAWLLVFLVCAPAVSEAHHNKGLPHYGYFENYPQVPTQEFIDEVGRWEVGVVLFNFQGMDRRTSDTPSDVRFFAYAYDIDGGRGYKGPLSLRVEHDGEAVASFDRLEPDSEGVYVGRQAMPVSGTYTLWFDLEPESGSVSVPLEFEVDLDVDRIDWAVLGGAATLLGGLFLLALSGRKLRRFRRAPAVLE